MACGGWVGCGAGAARRWVGRREAAGRGRPARWGRHSAALPRAGLLPAPTAAAAAPPSAAHRTCVMPPASPAATLDLRMKSSSEVCVPGRRWNKAQTGCVRASGRRAARPLKACGARGTSPGQPRRAAATQPGARPCARRARRRRRPGGAGAPHLAVVHVAHDGDHGRAGHQVLQVLLLDELCWALVWREGGVCGSSTHTASRRAPRRGGAAPAGPASLGAPSARPAAHPTSWRRPRAATRRGPARPRRSPAVRVGVCAGGWGEAGLR